MFQIIAKIFVKILIIVYYQSNDMNIILIKIYGSLHLLRLTDLRL